MSICFATVSILLLLAIMTTGCAPEKNSSSISGNADRKELKSIDAATLTNYRLQHYKLLPEDVIELKSSLSNSINGQYTISPQGTINLPGLGSHKARGLTANQLKQSLIQRAIKQDMDLKDLLITLIKSSGRHVHIFGHVQEDGPVAWKANKSTDQLFNQSGIQPGADMTRVIVLRPVAHAGFKVLQLNIQELNHISNGSQGIFQAGDVIYVPGIGESMDDQTIHQLQIRFKQYLPGTVTS